jgi:hypothetical protein
MTATGTNLATGGNTELGSKRLLLAALPSPTNLVAGYLKEVITLVTTALSDSRCQVYDVSLYGLPTRLGILTPLLSLANLILLGSQTHLFDFLYRKCDQATFIERKFFPLSNLPRFRTKLPHSSHAIATLIHIHPASYTINCYTSYL